jgi:GTP-binding protein
MANIELKTAYAGDIVSLAGCSQSTVGTTLNSQGVILSIPSIPIAPPMLSMEISINDSPLKGTEGKFNTVA